jgi:uncharacterized YccA/Bax inhibitor family protein
MKNFKRIAAIIGVILILSMYVISFVSALFSSPSAPGLFLASVFSTVVIPILIYGFITIYKMVHKNDIPTDKDDATSQSSSDSDK